MPSRLPYSSGVNLRETLTKMFTGRKARIELEFGREEGGFQEVTFRKGTRALVLNLAAGQTTEMGQELLEGTKQGDYVWHHGPTIAFTGEQDVQVRTAETSFMDRVSTALGTSPFKSRGATTPNDIWSTLRVAEVGSQVGKRFMSNVQEEAGFTAFLGQAIPIRYGKGVQKPDALSFLYGLGNDLEMQRRQGTTPLSPQEQLILSVTSGYVPEPKQGEALIPLGFFDPKRTRVTEETARMTTPIMLGRGGEIKPAAYNPITEAGQQGFRTLNVLSFEGTPIEALVRQGMAIGGESKSGSQWVFQQNVSQAGQEGQVIANTIRQQVTLDAPQINVADWAYAKVESGLFQRGEGDAWQRTGDIGNRAYPAGVSATIGMVTLQGGKQFPLTFTPERDAYLEQGASISMTAPKFFNVREGSGSLTGGPGFRTAANTFGSLDLQGVNLLGRQTADVNLFLGAYSTVGAEPKSLGLKGGETLVAQFANSSAMDFETVIRGEGGGGTRVSLGGAGNITKVPLQQFGFGVVGSLTSTQQANLFQAVGSFYQQAGNAQAASAFTQAEQYVIQNRQGAKNPEAVALNPNIVGSFFGEDPKSGYYKAMELTIGALNQMNPQDTYRQFGVASMPNTWMPVTRMTQEEFEIRRGALQGNLPKGKNWYDYIGYDPTSGVYSEFGNWTIAPQAAQRAAEYPAKQARLGPSALELAQTAVPGLLEGLPSYTPGHIPAMQAMLTAERYTRSMETYGKAYPIGEAAAALGLKIGTVNEEMATKLQRAAALGAGGWEMAREAAGGADILERGGRYMLGPEPMEKIIKWGRTGTKEDDVAFQAISGIGHTYLPAVASFAGGAGPSRQTARYDLLAGQLASSHTVLGEVSSWYSRAAESGRYKNVAGIPPGMMLMQEDQYQKILGALGQSTGLQGEELQAWRGKAEAQIEQWGYLPGAFMRSPYYEGEAGITGVGIITPKMAARKYGAQYAEATRVTNAGQIIPGNPEATGTPLAIGLRSATQVGDWDLDQMIAMGIVTADPQKGLHIPEHVQKLIPQMGDTGTAISRSLMSVFGEKHEQYNIISNMYQSLVEEGGQDPFDPSKGRAKSRAETLETSALTMQASFGKGTMFNAMRMLRASGAVLGTQENPVAGTRGLAQEYQPYLDVMTGLIQKRGGKSSIETFLSTATFGIEEGTNNLIFLAKGSAKDKRWTPLWNSQKRYSQGEAVANDYWDEYRNFIGGVLNEADLDPHTKAFLAAPATSTPEQMTQLEAAIVARQKTGQGVGVALRDVFPKGADPLSSPLGLAGLTAAVTNALIGGEGLGKARMVGGSEVNLGPFSETIPGPFGMTFGELAQGGPVGAARVLYQSMKQRSATPTVEEMAMLNQAVAEKYAGREGQIPAAIRQLQKIFPGEATAEGTAVAGGQQYPVSEYSISASMFQGILGVPSPYSQTIQSQINARAPMEVLARIIGMPTEQYQKIFSSAKTAATEAGGKFEETLSARYAGEPLVASQIGPGGPQGTVRIPESYFLRGLQAIAPGAVTAEDVARASPRRMISGKPDIMNVVGGKLTAIEAKYTTDVNADVAQLAQTPGIGLEPAAYLGILYGARERALEMGKTTQEQGELFYQTMKPWIRESKQFRGLRDEGEVEARKVAAGWFEATGQSPEAFGIVGGPGGREATAPVDLETMSTMLVGALGQVSEMEKPAAIKTNLPTLQTYAGAKGEDIKDLVGGILHPKAAHRAPKTGTYIRGGKAGQTTGGGKGGDIGGEGTVAAAGDDEGMPEWMKGLSGMIASGIKSGFEGATMRAIWGGGSPDQVKGALQEFSVLTQAGINEPKIETFQARLQAAFTATGANISIGTGEGQVNMQQAIMQGARTLQGQAALRMFSVRNPQMIRGFSNLMGDAYTMEGMLNAGYKTEDATLLPTVTGITTGGTPLGQAAMAGRLLQEGKAALGLERPSKAAEEGTMSMKEVKESVETIDKFNARIKELAQTMNDSSKSVGERAKAEREYNVELTKQDIAKNLMPRQRAAKAILDETIAQWGGIEEVPRATMTDLLYKYGEAGEAVSKAEGRLKAFEMEGRGGGISGATLGHMARNVLGGWGLMYMSRLAQMPLGFMEYGQQQADQFLSQSAQGLLGYVPGAMPYESTANVVRQAQIAYGGGAGAAIQRLGANAPSVARDIGGVGAGAVAGSMMSLWLGSMLTAGTPAAIAMTGPVGIGIGAAAGVIGATGLMVAGTRMDPGTALTGAATDVYGDSKFAWNTMKVNLFGTTQEKVDMALLQNAITQQRTSGVPLTTSLRNRPDLITAGITGESVSGFYKQYGPDIAQQVSSMYAKAGVVPTQEQIQFSANMRTAGVNMENITGALAAAGQAILTPQLQGAMEQGLTKYVGEDIVRLSKIQTGAQFMAQLSPEMGLALRGKYWQEGAPFKPYEDIADIYRQTPVIAQMIATESAIGQKWQGMGINYNLNLDFTNPQAVSARQQLESWRTSVEAGGLQWGVGMGAAKATPKELTTAEARLALVGPASQLGYIPEQILGAPERGIPGIRREQIPQWRQALEYGNQALAISGSMDAARAVTRYNLMGPQYQQLYGQLISGNPIAWTNLAMQGQIPSTGGPGTGMPATAPVMFGDINLQGQQTGLPWGTTSYQWGNVPAQQVTANVWGAGAVGPGGGWAGSALSNNPILNAAVTGYTMSNGQVVGGSMGAQLAANKFSYQGQMASIGATLRGIALQEEYMPQFFALNTQQAQLGYEQQMYGFGYQRQTFDIQNQYQMWQFGQQQQQMNRTRQWTQQDWGYQSQMRGLQFQWSTEDYEENVRFMSGRERRLAERQRGRDVMSYNLETGQIDIQRARQQELWDIQQKQFDKAKAEYKTLHDLQSQYMTKQEEFYKKSFELQETERKLQYEYQMKQLQLSKDAAGAQAYFATKTYEANQKLLEMADQESIAAGNAKLLGNNMISVLDIITNFVRELYDITGGELPDASDPLTDRSNNPGAGWRWDAEKGRWVPIQGGSAIGGVITSPRIVGEDGPEVAIPITPTSIISGNTLQAITRGLSDPWAGEVIPRYAQTASKLGGNSVIKIYIGNELLGKYVIDTTSKEIRMF